MTKNTVSLRDRLNKINSNIYSETNGQLEPTSDPAISALAYSQAEFEQGLYIDMYDSINQCFVRTATEESFLAANAFDKTNNKIQRKGAEFAIGEILVVSEAMVDVPVGSQFITSDGNVYETTVFRSTSSQSFIVSALERIDNISYATIADHNLGNLMELSFSGANETEFNVTAEITIVDKDTISYENIGDDENATGTISAAFFGNRIEVKSLLPNESANKTYTNAIEIGFTTDLTDSYITYNGIVGGQDIEDLFDFKARIEKYLQYPQNAGNIYQHISWVEQNSDVNYCYFFNHEDALYLYLTAVVSKLSDDYYFTNFTTDELNYIKTKFIDNNQFPFSGASSIQLSFVNFTPVTINITITGLLPLSNSMKSAVENKLRAYIALLPINFYLDSAQLSQSKISSVISGARDAAGNIPAIDSVSVSGATFTTNTQKPILGTVTYA